MLPLRPCLRIVNLPSPSCPFVLLQISLLVRPSAHSSRQGITAINSSHVALNVSAPAVDGRANVAVTEVIARVLKVAKTDVRVVRGERGREKAVEVKVRDVEKVGKKGAEGGELILERVRTMLEGAVVGTRQKEGRGGT
ncbi:hypothetical protein IQ06DRAFT_340357 [Phaeosphaeriaceae sp. SRC1lsM3a]|nr:hypothetical protein IQ06DRAFT_340357 [Stagonospora sp. SRC1lsM3a]